MNNFLGHFDWHSTSLPHDVDSTFNTFYDALHQSIIDYVPKFVFHKSTNPLCYSKELKQIVFLFFSKQKSSRQIQTIPNYLDYNKLSLLRAKFHYVLKKCLNEYTKNADSSLKNNLMKFWKFLYKNRVNYTNIFKVILLNDNISFNKLLSGFNFSHFEIWWPVYYLKQQANFN